MSGYSIKNRVIIVTGGSGGIGSAIVNRLTRKEALVVSVYHRNRPADILFDNVVQIKADLTKSEEWDKLISFTLNKFGRIDALINCCGILEPGEFSSLEEIQFRKMIDTNFISVLIGISKTFKILKDQQSGHIINIGSLGGIVPMPYSSVYSAVKFALRGFTFSLAEELKGTDIHVSLITPGSVITKMLDYEAQDNNTSISFVSKPISPDQVANAVLKVIRKPKTELIVPKGQSLASKLLIFSPKIYSILYRFLHKVGLQRKQSYLNRYCTFNLVKGVSK